ncbi:uncharacterized protein EI90DRAFT_3061644, partial [Cantharellus anzutake]|uniref:uncharacterized protein n=1 Tax=Cantharellus anzutake TaxID=1750568 RepID=UPI001903B866
MILFSILSISRWVRSGYPLFWTSGWGGPPVSSVSRTEGCRVCVGGEPGWNATGGHLPPIMIQSGTCLVMISPLLYI